MKSRWIVVLVAVLGIGGNVKAGNIGAYTLGNLYNFTEYEITDSIMYQNLLEISKQATDYCIMFLDDKAEQNMDKIVAREEFENAAMHNYVIQFQKTDNLYYLVEIRDVSGLGALEYFAKKYIGVTAVGNAKLFIRRDDRAGNHGFIQRRFRETGRKQLFYDIPHRYTWDTEYGGYSTTCGKAQFWTFVVDSRGGWHFLCSWKDTVKTYMGWGTWY